MQTIGQLKRERAKLLASKQRNDQRRELKKEIFELKHAPKVAFLRRVGSLGVAGAKKIGSTAVRYGEYYQRNEVPSANRSLRLKKRRKATRQAPSNSILGSYRSGSVF